MRTRYTIVLFSVLALMFAAIDLYNYECVLLPFWIAGLLLVCCVLVSVKAFRRFAKLGFLSLGCSVAVLGLAGVVGVGMNGRNQADAVNMANEIERFRVRTGSYPGSISEVSSLEISKERLRFRARWVYSPKENDDYFLEIQMFPVGFVKWNRATKTWDEEPL